MSEVRAEARGSVEFRDSPYFGLDYYQEKFGAWFFGREAEGSKIITNLRAARLTLLHAESGVGKSSLLRAGVAWRLRGAALDGGSRRATRYVPVVFSSWKDDPVPALVDAISEAIEPYLGGRPKPELPDDRLDTAIEVAAGMVNANLLIMLDQFEEYFLYSASEPVPERFADELARCVNRPDLPANFLIAIREDAYAGLGDLFKGRLANVYGNFLQIEYLDRGSAEKAIRDPLEIYNRQPGVAQRVEIQDELVEAVLDQVRAYDSGGNPTRGGPAGANGGGHVSTPLLQLVMETVWERERALGSSELRYATLQRLEGVEKIVDTHLAKALRALGSSERVMAIDMFDHLVSPSGGKIAESVPDLAHRTGHSEEQVGGVLDKLDHARVVRPVPAAPGQDARRFRRYEIFHDVLAPAINRTITAREEQRRARARLRGLAVLALGLVAIAMVVLVIALIRANSADRSTAQSRQLAAAAEANATRDPELSALLALQALRLHYTSQAETALRDALPNVQELRTFRDNTTVPSAVFDPANANLAASAEKNGVTQIWDVKTGRVLFSLTPKGGFHATGTANTVAFNHAGTKVAVGYGLSQVVLFDVGSRRQVAETNVGSSVNDVQFMGRTDELAIAARDNVRLWPRAVPLSCGGAFTAEQANTVTADPRNPLEFAVATDTGTTIWQLRSNYCPRHHRPLNAGAPSKLGNNDAEFNPAGTQVVTADNDGFVRVYDLATFQEARELGADEGTATSASFSSDGQEVVAGYTSGAARVWNVATGFPLTVLAGDASAVNTAKFAVRGSDVITASNDGTIRVWDAQPRELQAQYSFATPPYLPWPFYAAQYSSGGGRILSVDGSGSARVLTARGQPVYSGGHAVAIHPGGTYVKTARFNRAGTEIVTANGNGSVDLWHATGSDYAQIDLPSPIGAFPDGSAYFADFSPNGSRLVILTTNDIAEVRSASTGRLLLPLLSPRHDFQLSVASYSPNGQVILTGDDNGQVERWNAANGHQIRPALGAPGPAITDVQYNRSGSEFVTASSAGVVTIWNAHDYRPLLAIDACPTPNTASFSPKGSKVVVGCGNGSAPVFDARTGNQLTVLPGTGLVNSAAFSPDGKSIVITFGANGTGGLEIWNSQLANPSVTALEQLAEHRITRRLTPAERKLYLAGIRG